MNNGQPEPSLHLDFNETRTKIIMRAVERHRDDLVRLATRFRTGAQLGPLAITVDLDDLLSQLNLLSTWPSPHSVQWADELAELVRGNVDDSTAVQTQLDNPRAARAVGADEVPSLLGDDWVGDLREFQRRDIAKLLSLRHGANFSVPGAGKTRVALAVFAAQRAQGSAQRVLVVCPKSAYEAWQFESVACFRRPLRTQVFERSIDSVTEVLIINYERLSRSAGVLAAWLKAAPSMMILDEAHRMKLGTRGAYGSACMALGPLARRRLILTGTPAPNGPKDLESLMGFSWPGYGHRTVASAVAGGDLAHASTVLRPLFARTTKLELGLPPMETRVRFVDMPALHSQIYDSLVGKEAGLSARDDLAALGRTALRLLMAATSPALLLDGETRYEPIEYQLPPLDIPKSHTLYTLLKRLPDYELSPKYQEAAAIVAANAARGRKTLVWTTFVRSLTTLHKLLAAYQPAIIHGSTIDRTEELHRFQNDPDCLVLVSNPATLGEGISLHQVCHDAVYVDRDFVAGRFLQSLDRIHRLGLAADVETRVTVLAARDTIDEVVELRLAKKLEFMGKILDDPSVQQLSDLEEEPAVASGLEPGDVQALLSHITR
ncbi:MAG TPA: DEAD/DEAH box helicase [Pseudonocardiaceae bacterium]|nr:DEAD/DEAH box helicase [Pseudonocardiaceae bacterium]